MITNPNLTNLNEIIGQMVSDFFQEREAEKELVASELQNGVRRLIMMLTVAFGFLMVSLYVVPEQYRNAFVKPAPIVSFISPSLLTSTLDLAYEKKIKLISPNDYLLIQRYFSGTAIIRSTQTRCIQSVCSQYLMTDQLRVKFTLNKKGIMYITVNVLE